MQILNLLMIQLSNVLLNLYDFIWKKKRNVTWYLDFVSFKITHFFLNHFLKVYDILYSNIRIVVVQHYETSNPILTTCYQSNYAHHVKFYLSLTPDFLNMRIMVILYHKDEDWQYWMATVKVKSGVLFFN